jgi:hypothetical protein
MSTDEASTTRHANLAGAFAPSPRPGRLAGILPPRKDRAAADDQTSVDENPRPPAPENDVERRRASKSGTPATTVALDDEHIVNMPVYLPPDMLELTRDLVRTRATTYSELLFDAFEALTADSLADALTASFAPRPQTGAGGVPRRAIQARGEAGIQRQFRVTEAQRRWVDEKVVETGAPSRSALCAEVLRLYLEQS